MLTAFLLLAIAGLAPAEGPFQDLTLDQALAAAKRDQKVVMIDWFTTWCGPCKKLDATTWKDAEVLAWLGAKAVALKIDAEKEVELAKKHRIGAYPTMLFLKADGSEIDRIVGYKTSKDFLSEAQDALAGKNAVARAKEKLAGHEKDPMARSAHADELARAGRYDEALAEYLWCFDEGHKAAPSYSGVRVSFLLGHIADLGRSHPPAIKALEDRRDAAEARVLDGSGSDDDLGDAVALNRELNATGRTLALYDRMRKERPITPTMRFRLSSELLAPLVEAKRYQDALDLFDSPDGFVKWRIKQFEQSSKLVDADRGEEFKQAMAYMRKQIVSECGSMYEALVGAGKTEIAAQVAARLIAFAPSGTTYAALVDFAIRAEAPDVARGLAAAGLEKLPEAERAEVRSAQERIPASK